MIEAIATILGSSAAGSLIGGVFGWLNRKEDRKDKESERRFKIAMLEAQANFEQQTSEARAFEESQKTISKVGDAIKSAVRPIITALLLIQTFFILTSLEQITGGLAALPSELTVDLYRDIVLSVISLTSLCVSWWFASRPSALRDR